MVSSTQLLLFVKLMIDVSGLARAGKADFYRTACSLYAKLTVS